MIPGAGRAGARSAPAAPDEAEAERIAADFEREVRERLLSAPEPAPSPLQRHRRLLLPALAGLVVAAAAGVYLYVDSANASQLSATAATRARAGLARDTVGALREAARLLGEARRRAIRPELDSLAAQVAAVLASEHGDAAARALAAELAGSGSAGDGALVARRLLAATPAERAAAEAGVLVAPPSSEPLVQALAGRILIARGEVDAGRGRLEIAAHASPPLLRALSDLGDSALAGDDPEGALALYSAALSAHPTHPRAATGAAEARLELGRELDRSRRELAAIDADPASAPPRDLAVRYEIAHARVLAATGDGAEAARRLSRAAARLGETPELLTATVEVHLAARAWDRAEAAAARAVALSPRDARARVLLARARIGRSRFAEALAATGSFGDRAVRLQRAIARFRLGQIPEARAELEHIARGGRMPAEAAIWYALTDVQLGRPERARTVLEKLAAAKSPPPLLAVALGQALEAEGKLAEAEQAYRASVARDPAAPEGRAALGSFLLARGDFAGALRELEQAVGADPAGFDARRALGAARLAAGHPAQARAELDAVLLARPADLEALRLLSAAWLAEGQPQEARRAAGRGLARAPRHVGLLVAAARAALAQGDRAAAKGLSDRAVRSAGHGAQAPEARTLAAEVGRRKG
jgi:tetratricopeptide (TPR) repeat protein